MQNTKKKHKNNSGSNKSKKFKKCTAKFENERKEKKRKEKKMREKKRKEKKGATE